MSYQEGSDDGFEGLLMMPWMSDVPVIQVFMITSFLIFYQYLYIKVTVRHEVIIRRMIMSMSDSPNQEFQNFILFNFINLHF